MSTFILAHDTVNAVSDMESPSKPPHGQRPFRGNPMGIVPIGVPPVRPSIRVDGPFTGIPNVRGCTLGAHHSVPDFLRLRRERSAMHRDFCGKSALHGIYQQAF